MFHVIELINPLRRARGLFYGWWMVGVSALVMALGGVPLFAGMAAWFPVLETRFGWTRAQLSWAFSLTRAEGSVMGPVAGYLIERLGSRRMVLIGLPILGGGFLLLSRIQELWHLYAAFIVMSLGAGLGTWLPMMTTLNSWFVRRRAMAMALAAEGFAIGGIVLVPLLAWAIDPEAFGPDRWRSIAAGIGVVIILLAFPISRLVRNRPEDYGQHPDGVEPAPSSVRAGPIETPQAAVAAPGLTWQEAIRTRTFWLITMGHASSSMVLVTLMVHMGSMLNLDRGLSLQTVGWVVAVYTGVGAVFTLIGGYMGDRVSMRQALFFYSAIQSVAVVVLLLADSASMAFLFAVILGIGSGGRNPLSTAIRGLYFGRRAFASITGISMVPMNVLLFAAPIFAGYMRDFRGSYEIPLLVVAWVSFLGACMFLLLGQPRSWTSSSQTPE